MQRAMVGLFYQSSLYEALSIHTNGVSTGTISYTLVEGLPS